MKRTLFVNTVLLIIVLFIFNYMNKRAKTPNITLFEINNIISDNFFNEDYLKYDHIFINDVIPKQHYDNTFSEAVVKKMNTPTSSSFLEVHNFLKREENDNFIESQRSRFDVPAFKLLAKNIILPYFTDVIFKQMTHYSQYLVLGSIFTMYNSGIRNTDKCMHEIFDVFNLMLRFSSNKPVKIQIHLLFTDLKKRSSPGEGILGLAKNINSGMTFGNTVIVWRTEEMVKVFIHEMVHLLKLDMGTDGNIILGRILDSMSIYFSDDSIYSLGEAYTETVAKIIYSMHKSKGSDGFMKELYRQIEWSISQCSRILFLNGIKEIGKDINVITQYTYMVEYYVLHAFFMHNIRTTRDISVYINFFKQNSNHIPPVNLAEHLSSLDTSMFIKEINELLDEIPSNFQNTPRNLKMSPG